MTEFNEAKYAEGREVLVSVHDVRRTFWRGEEPVHALDGVTLNIYRGEYICVMGPSGSGKSTFFNAVGGLDTPTSGRVFIDGVDMAQLNADELAFLRCRKIGYVFQQFNLNTTMTALDNVTLPMVFAGVSADESRARGMALLERVGLGDRWNHRPKEMSGGQMQRVAIARARQQPVDPALRRADGQPRPQERQGHPPAAARPEQEGRRHRHLRHARPEHALRLRPHGLDHRRPHRPHRRKQERRNRPELPRHRRR